MPRGKAKVPDGPAVINITDAGKAVKQAVAKILIFRNKRSELNAQIAEERARCKNLGVPPAALDLAIKMKESDPEVRRKHDEGYLIARDALGLRVQTDLFGADGPEANEPDEDDGEDEELPTAASHSSAMDKAREHLGGAAH